MLLFDQNIDELKPKNDVPLSIRLIRSKDQVDDEKKSDR